MKKILVVAPTFTHPSIQGNSLRIAKVGEILKRNGFVVDFLYFALDGLKFSMKDMAKVWNQIYVVRPERKPIQKFPKFWGLDDWCPEHLENYVTSLVNKKHYSAVIVNYVWLSKIFEQLDGPLKILDTHDLFSERSNKAEKNQILPNWYFTSLEEEKKGFNRADVVIGIQDQERREIQKVTSSKTFTLGHRMAPKHSLKTTEAAFFCGYIGSKNPWNRHSVKSLVQTMEINEIHWLLAGSICDNYSRDHSPYMCVLGRVERLEDFYNETRFFLNPMVEATGLKIKTIEAMSFGKGVLGTKEAFAGLSSDNEFHNIDGPGEFSDALKELKSSKNAQKALIACSLELLKKYNLEVIKQEEEFVNLLNSN